MRSAVVGVALLIAVGPAVADRPIERRSDADYIISGTVDAVYSRETEGYREFVIEIRVEGVEKGAGVRQGDTFRAFCYKRREGVGGLEFDSAGHDLVPGEGQRIKAFVNRAGGRNEGVYPDWAEVLLKPGR